MTLSKVANLMQQNSLSFEQAYGIAWRKHREAVDGWDGVTWSTPGYNSNASEEAAQRICAALSNMPGYAGKVCRNPRIVSRCIKKGLAYVDHKRGTERYVVLTPEGREYLGKHKKQGTLF